MTTTLKKVIIFWIFIVLFSLEGASWARYHITFLNIGDNLIYYGYSRELTPEQIRNTQAKRHYYIKNLISLQESRIFDDEKEKEIGECFYLVISTNKKHILIVSIKYISNLPQIRFYLMDTITKEIKFLQQSNNIVTGPMFSPDTKYIAFYSSNPQVDEWQNDLNGDHKASALMKLNIETGESVEVSPASYVLFQYSAPSWSPDGKEIVFVAQYSSEFKNIPQIYKVGSDGKNLKQLTSNDMILGGSVSWMYNGKILFNLYGSRKDPNKKQGIYKMDSQGENLIHLLSIPINLSAFHENIDKKSFIYNTHTAEDRKIMPFVINEQGENITENKQGEIFEYNWKY
ncbi:PD40 domain-containing protein [Candidatus Sumerlaeota bacterium]|nr:PD40 domain-containing protein [Candidatus Sumerlaeota bacterium]